MEQKERSILTIQETIGVMALDATISVGVSGEDEYETRPLPPIEEWQPESARSSWQWLGDLLAWVEQFLQRRMSSLLLAIMTLGIIGMLLGFGFGIGILAYISLLVGSLSATVWILLRQGGVFDEPEPDDNWLDYSAARSAGSVPPYIIDEAVEQKKR